MPAEKFYVNGTSDAKDPQLTVSWGETPTPQVLINGAQHDRSALNRLIGVLHKARDQVYGADT